MNAGALGISDAVLVALITSAGAAVVAAVPSIIALVVAARNRTTAAAANRKADRAADGCEALAEAVQQLYGLLAARYVADGLDPPEVPPALVDYLARRSP